MIEPMFSQQIGQSLSEKGSVNESGNKWVSEYLTVCMHQVRCNAYQHLTSGMSLSRVNFAHRRQGIAEKGPARV